MDTTDGPTLHVCACFYSVTTVFHASNIAHGSQFLFSPHKKVTTQSFIHALTLVLSWDPDSLWRCGPGSVPAACFAWSFWLRRCWFSPQKVKLQTTICTTNMWLLRALFRHVWPQDKISLLKNQNPSTLKHLLVGCSKACLPSLWISVVAADTSVPVVGLSCCSRVGSRRILERVKACYEQKPRAGCKTHAFR